MKTTTARNVGELLVALVVTTAAAVLGNATMIWMLG